MIIRAIKSSVASEGFPLALIAVTLILVWVMQNILPLNHDVAWLLYAAEQMLAGARLYEDIIEVNPPLAPALLVLPVALAKILSVDSVVVFRLVLIFILAVLALFYCRLLDRATQNKNRALNRYLVFSLIIFIGLYRSGNFGQREQLLMILILPYLLAMLSRLNNITLPLSTAVMAGLLGAIAISLKPHYLPCVVLVELFLLFRRRSIYAVFRPESLSLGVFGLLYIVLVYLLTPKYFSFMIPTAVDVYWVYSEPFANLFLPIIFLFLIFAPLGYICMKSDAIYLDVWKVFFLAALGSLLAYFLQGTPWTYHLIPYFILLGSMALFSLLLIIRKLVATEQAVKPYKSKTVFPLVLFVCLALLTFKLPASLAKTALKNMATSSQLPEFLEHSSAVDAQVQRLINHYAQGGGLMVFSSDLWPAFPSVNHLNLTWSSRFPTLWLIPALVRDDRPVGDKDYRSRLKSLEQYQYQSVMDDLRKNLPTLIMVETTLHKPHFAETEFDFLAYFLKMPEFQSFWQHYQLVDSQVFKRYDSEHIFDFYVKKNSIHE